MKHNSWYDFMGEPRLLGFSISDLQPLRQACDTLRMTPKDLLVFALKAEHEQLRTKMRALEAELGRLTK